METGTIQVKADIPTSFSLPMRDGNIKENEEAEKRLAF